MPTWTGAGADNNWNTAANWDTGVPAAGTTAVFDGVAANGNKNCTITAGATCVSINTTGYTGQLNFANGLTVAGNITWGAGTTFGAGTGGLVITGTCTFTSNGRTFPNGIVFSAATTFADTFDIGGNFDVRGITITLNASGTCNSLFNNFNNDAYTINVNGVGQILNIKGNLTIGIRAIQGTAKFKMICSSGTGTWSHPGGSDLWNDIEIDATANITFGGGVMRGSITYTNVGGTFSATGTLSLVGGTHNLKNSIWAGLSLLGGTTTFSNVSGTPTFTSVTTSSAGVNPTLVGTIKVSGGCDFGGTRSLLGAGTIEFIGTGTFSAPLQFSANIVINTAQTITFGTVIWGFGGVLTTWTHTAGTTAPGTGTFTVVHDNAVFNISSTGFNVNNLTFAAGTRTLIINTGIITINGNLVLTGNTTFRGNGGWTAANWSDTTAGRIVTLATGSRYAVTSTLTLTATSASFLVMTSSVAPSSSIFTLRQGAQQNVSFVRATDQNSGEGQTIWDFVGASSGILTRTTNWNTFPNQYTLGFGQTD